MSIVQPYLSGARVLDLFAGSGALGLEALSRGAVSADLVEVSQAGITAIRENAAALDAGAAVRVHRADAMRFIEKLEPGAFDVAFADPPYGHGLAKRVVERWLEVPFAGLLGVEHAAKEAMPEGDTRRYGSTAISFYSAAPSS
ncbi:MAG: methyltransferase [Geminicoccaceae bacterium]|nr:methyltransferase [Geminicoccaceae bacterium]